jgi:hypothetical protein
MAALQRKIMRAVGSLKLVRGPLKEVLVRSLNRGVVNENVQSSKLLCASFDEFGAMAFLSDITRD